MFVGNRTFTWRGSLRSRTFWQKRQSVCFSDSCLKASLLKGSAFGSIARRRHEFFLRWFLSATGFRKLPSFETRGQAKFTEIATRAASFDTQLPVGVLKLFTKFQLSHTSISFPKNQKIWWRAATVTQFAPNTDGGDQFEKVPTSCIDHFLCKAWQSQGSCFARGKVCWLTRNC